MELGNNCYIGKENLGMEMDEKISVIPKAGQSCGSERWYRERELKWCAASLRAMVCEAGFRAAAAVVP